MRTEDPLEGDPELRAEDGVDDGIEHGVGIAEPEEEADEGVAEEGARRADGKDQGSDEEREPADDEGARHDRQGLGCLSLAFGLQRLALPLASPALPCFCLRLLFLLFGFVSFTVLFGLFRLLEFILKYSDMDIVENE